MGVRVKKQDLGLDTDSCSGQACEHEKANDSLSKHCCRAAPKVMLTDPQLFELPEEFQPEF